MYIPELRNCFDMVYNNQQLYYVVGYDNDKVY